jgi:hypothetical protein
VKQLAPKPFALIGIHGLGYEPKKLKAVMDKEKLNWRSFVDRGIIFSKWSSRGTPTYYVINHQGIIRHKWIGYPGTKTIDDALEKLIKEAEVSEKSVPK